MEDEIGKREKGGKRERKRVRERERERECVFVCMFVFHVAAWAYAGLGVLGVSLS